MWGFFKHFWFSNRHHIYWSSSCCSLSMTHCLCLPCTSSKFEPHSSPMPPLDFYTLCLKVLNWPTTLHVRSATAQKKTTTKKNIHPPCQTIFENTWRLGLRLFCVPNIHAVKSKFTLSIRNAGISGKITRIFQNPIGQNYLWQNTLTLHEKHCKTLN